MFTLKGLVFTVHYYMKTYPEIGKSFWQSDMKLVNNSDRSIKGIQLLYEASPELGKWFNGKEWFNEPIDLAPGEVWTRTGNSGRIKFFEIYRYDIFVYAGGPFTKEDRDSMVITVSGEP